MKNVKQQVIDSLKGNFQITRVNKFYGNDDSELRIKAEFIYNGRKGKFVYTLLGAENGIDESEFDEREGENIYGEINDWVDEHIKFWTIVKLDGKEIK